MVTFHESTDKVTRSGSWRSKMVRPHQDIVLPQQQSDPCPVSTLFPSLLLSPSISQSLRIHQIRQLLWYKEAEMESFLFQTHSIRIEKEKCSQANKWTFHRNLILTQGHIFFFFNGARNGDIYGTVFNLKTPIFQL